MLARSLDERRTAAAAAAAAAAAEAGRAVRIPNSPVPVMVGGYSVRGCFGYQFLHNERSNQDRRRA